jgi:hypothetical protein
MIQIYHVQGLLQLITSKLTHNVQAFSSTHIVQFFIIFLSKTTHNVQIDA